MKNRRKYLLYIFIVLIFIIGYLGWTLFGPTITEPEKKYFYINTGSNYQTVKNNLLQKKIISGTFWFDRIANYLDYDKSIKPGKYKINEGMSLVNLVRMLRSGNQSPVNLVITKLRTKEDLAKKIGNDFECDSVSVINFLNDNDSLLKYKLDTNTLMTAVIPNTYSLTWNNTPEKIFKMLSVCQRLAKI